MSTSEEVDVSRGEQLAAALNTAARELVTRGGLDQTLRLIVTGAIATIPGVARAGISLVGPGGVITSEHPSDDIVAELDTLQNQLGEGPCRDAIWDHQTIRADDLAGDSRWPRFAAAAAERGIAGMLAFQLFADPDRDSAGALNLYTAVPGGLDQSSHDVGALFASQAAIALYGANQAQTLTRAIASRDVIGQAKGILMERHDIDDETAFAMLVRASQNLNLKLVAVATWLAEHRGEGSSEAGEIQ